MAPVTASAGMHLGMRAAAGAAACASATFQQVHLHIWVALLQQKLLSKCDVHESE